MDRCERADLHGYAEGLMAAVSEVNVQVIETGWVQRRGGYQRAEQSLSLHRGHAAQPYTERQLGTHGCQEAYPHLAMYRHGAVGVPHLKQATAQRVHEQVANVPQGRARRRHGHLYSQRVALRQRRGGQEDRRPPPGLQVAHPLPPSCLQRIQHTVGPTERASNAV